MRTMNIFGDEANSDIVFLQKLSWRGSGTEFNDRVSVVSLQNIVFINIRSYLYLLIHTYIKDEQYWRRY